jgi:hypothetical protein
MKTLIALSIASLLAACGGGGSEAEPELAPAQAPVAVAYGDSVWAKPATGPGPVEYAAQALGQVVLNGADSSPVASPLHTFSFKPSPDTPKVVLLGWGLNEQIQVGWDGQTYPMPVGPVAPHEDRIGEAWSTTILIGIIQDVQLSGRRPILVESTPIVPGGTLSATRSETLRLKVETRIRKPAADLIGAAYCAMPARTWTLDDKPDGIHLSDSAARWVGDVIAECVRKG